MTHILMLHLSFQDLCRSAELPEQTLAELVEYGIVEPQLMGAGGQAPQDWWFDAAALASAKRATRLRRDLDIEWAGVALALQLLGELDQLRAENLRLRQRLDRFQSE